MANTSSRTLRLLSLLQTRRYWPGEELAGQLLVSPRTLRRDIDRLRELGYPIQAQRGGRAATSWEGSASASVDPGVLTAIALACRDAERIRFSYTAADGRQAERHVEPHRLVLFGRRWYLAGYDLDRNGWRSYRLDRLAGPRGTGAGQAPGAR